MADANRSFGAFLGYYFSSAISAVSLLAGSWLLWHNVLLYPKPPLSFGFFRSIFSWTMLECLTLNGCSADSHWGEKSIMVQLPVLQIAEALPHVYVFYSSSELLSQMTTSWVLISQSKSPLWQHRQAVLKQGRAGLLLSTGPPDCKCESSPS